MLQHLQKAEDGIAIATTIAAVVPERTDQPGRLACSLHHLQCFYCLHSTPAIDHGKERRNKVPGTGNS
jgi:hypothetical protein